MATPPDPVVRRSEDAFSANLLVLLRVRDMKRSDLVKRSESSGGPSKKTIYNVLNKAHPPNLDTWASIAKQLDVPLWVLLIPGLDKHEDLLGPAGMKRLVMLVEHYMACNLAKRSDIETVAKAGSLTSRLDK